MHTVPVLLAGGIGERFWPLSRSRRPKQLLTLAGRRSMLEETLSRISPLCTKETRPMIVTSKAIGPLLRRQIGSRCSLVVEPIGKNTAPAVAIAAAMIEKQHGPSVMVVLSADHAISPRAEFIRAVRYAARVAREEERLVVFGVPPSRPDIGYGYVELGTELGSEHDETSYNVKRFVEKPDWNTAVQYCASGQYLWNSGMFIWKTSVILEEFRTHMPKLYRQTMAAAKAGFTRAAIDRFYRLCDKESIDYGVMERSTRVAAVRGHFLWDDVGSWESVARVRPGNERHNTTVGRRVFEQGCDNSIIVNDSTLNVAAFGLDNIVLVATDDAVMAIPRSELPRMKEYLKAMKEDGRFGAKLF